MLTPHQRQKVETYLALHEQATNITWSEGGDTATSHDSNGTPIEDYFITLNEDGTLEYTTTSDWQTTLPIE